MPKKNLAVLLVVDSAMLLATVPVCAQSSQSADHARGRRPTDHRRRSAPPDAARGYSCAAKADYRCQHATLSEEATKFWPIYDQYRAEATKNGDERWQLIKDYADNYQTMTDAQAQDYIKREAANDAEGSHSAHEVRADVREGYLTEEDRAVLPDRSPYRSHGPVAAGVGDPNGRREIEVGDFRWTSSASPGALLFDLARAAWPGLARPGLPARSLEWPK